MSIFTDAWDAIEDVVTLDTLLTVLGSALTLGSYGYITGILSAAEQVAVQESMNAVAFAGERALGELITTGKVKLDISGKGFVDAWKGQVVYRTKKMIMVAGPAVASAALAELTSKLADPETLRFLKTSYDRVNDGKKKAEDVQRDVLALARTACHSAHADPRTWAKACRDDVLALAANVSTGKNLFDTTNWDPKTGAYIVGVIANPLGVQLTKKPLSVLDLEKDWHYAQRLGLPSDLVDALGAKYQKAATQAQHLKDLGIKPDINAYYPAVDLIKATAPAGATKGAFTQVLTAAFLLSPLWVPFVWPRVKGTSAVRQLRRLWP